MKHLFVAVLIVGTILASSTTLAEVPIAANPGLSERVRITVVNPANPKQLTALVERNDRTQPTLYRSTNAGKTWAEGPALPYQAYNITYAANGRLYLAFTDPFESCGPRVMVSHSDDKGLTWSTPVIALKGASWYGFTSPKLTASNDGWIYVTATVDHCGGSATGVGFARSPDGQHWFRTPEGEGIFVYGNVDINPVGGPKIAAGAGGNVIVAVLQYDNPWDCQADAIRIVRSTDHGATFGPLTTAVPSTCDHGAGSYDIKIGTKDTAHIVYQADTDIDDGNINYVWSGAPYTTWSAPVPISDDPGISLQSAPVLATQKCGTSTVLHVAWFDQRVPGFNNAFYSTKAAKNGTTWSPNQRLSTKPSGSPDIVASKGRAVATWTVEATPGNVDAIAKLVPYMQCR